jgi:hypothetical protein
MIRSSRKRTLASAETWLFAAAKWPPRNPSYHHGSNTVGRPPKPGGTSPGLSRTVSRLTMDDSFRGPDAATIVNSIRRGLHKWQVPQKHYPSPTLEVGSHCPGGVWANQHDIDLVEIPPLLECTEDCDQPARIS